MTWQQLLSFCGKHKKKLCDKRCNCFFFEGPPSTLDCGCCSSMLEHFLSRLNFSPHENILTSNSLVASSFSRAPSTSVEELYTQPLRGGCWCQISFYWPFLRHLLHPDSVQSWLAWELGNPTFVRVEHELWLELAANSISLKAHLPVVRAPHTGSSRTPTVQPVCPAPDVACFLP